MRKPKTLSGFSVLCALSLMLSPLGVTAEPMAADSVEPPVVITEVQTGSEEFVELYNLSDAPVDITGWQVRYLSSGSPADSTTLLATVASPDDSPVILSQGQYYVLYAFDINLPEAAAGQAYPAGLSGVDQTIALFARDGEVCEMAVTDALAWETATGTTLGEGTAVQMEDDGSEKILQRRLDDQGKYVDTDNNAYDFVPAVATPGADNSPHASVVSGVGSPSPLEPFMASDCALDEPELPDGGLPPPQLTELLPNPQGTDTGNEFIELHNPNDEPFDLSGYILEAGLTTKHRYTFPEGTSMAAGEYRAFSSADTGVTLTNSSGQAWLLDRSETMASQSDPYGSAGEGQTWALIDGVWQWAEPTPGAANDLPPDETEEPDEEAPAPNPEEPEEEEAPAPGPNDGLSTPFLTELLPNPGSPFTDAADEYIELYNPGDEPLDLSDYVIEVGITTLRRYTIPDGTQLVANSYLAFFSAETGLALSNSGGQARLIDPLGAVVSQTDEYGAAKDDQAWALVGGVWQWTIKPTPNTANSAEAPVAAVKSASTTAKKTAKPKTTSSAKPKATKTDSKDKDNVEQFAATASSNTPLHPGILAGIAVAALLYGAYEYRHDVANRFYQLRSNRAARRAARQIVEGR